MTDTRSQRLSPPSRARSGPRSSALSRMPGTRATTHPRNQRFKVYVAGQKRGLTAAIKRAFRRRSAVEPTIGHLKNEHRMGRNHLAGRAGDAANAVLAAVGYNFGLLLRWLALLLRIVLAVLAAPSHSNRTIVAS